MYKALNQIRYISFSYKSRCRQFWADTLAMLHEVSRNTGISPPTASPTLVDSIVLVLECGN